MALKIYAGNQLEELARVFCEEIYSGNHSIFEQEKVVVQTRYVRKRNSVSSSRVCGGYARFGNSTLLPSAYD